MDVITAYPIRPYTAIMMNLSQFIADGILDAEYLHADGEHAQLSAAFGAASCGARAFTGSSGVGVTYAYEMYSIISGARIPIQMSIADRTLDPPGDFGSEHTDALCTRDMGWLLGWAATPQEVFDKSLIAMAIGEDPRVLLPQMVVQDGYFVSHIAGEVELPSAAQVDAYLPPYQLPFALDPRRPVSHGPQIHPEQGPPLQLERARAMEDAIPVIRQKTDEFARRRSGGSTRTSSRSTCWTTRRSRWSSPAATRSPAGRRSGGCASRASRSAWPGCSGSGRSPATTCGRRCAGSRRSGWWRPTSGLGGASYGGILSLDVTDRALPGRLRAAAGHLVHGRAGRRDRAGRRVRLDGRQAGPGGRPAAGVEKAAHWVGFED